MQREKSPIKTCFRFTVVIHWHRQNKYYMISAIRKFIAGHKFLSFAMAVAVILGGYYWHSKATSAGTAPKYLISEAATGTGERKTTDSSEDGSCYPA